MRFQAYSVPACSISAVRPISFLPSFLGAKESSLVRHAAREVRDGGKGSHDGPLLTGGGVIAETKIAHLEGRYYLQGAIDALESSREVAGKKIMAFSKPRKPVAPFSRAAAKVYRNGSSSRRADLAPCHPRNVVSSDCLLYRWRLGPIGAQSRPSVVVNGSLHARESLVSKCGLVGCSCSDWIRISDGVVMG